MISEAAAAVVSFADSIITRLFPDPHAQAAERLKVMELAQKGDLAELNAHVQLMLGQLRVNEQEAKHKSVFVAGWRPAVGWVCVLIMFFNFIGIYLLEYLNSVFDLVESLPDRFDMTELWPVLLGMLGIGGMRSFDKSKGVETNSI